MSQQTDRTNTTSSTSSHQRSLKTQQTFYNKPFHLISFETKSDHVQPNRANKSNRMSPSANQQQQPKTQSQPAKRKSRKGLRVSIALMSCLNLMVYVDSVLCKDLLDGHKHAQQKQEVADFHNSPFEPSDLQQNTIDTHVEVTKPKKTSNETTSLKHRIESVAINGSHSTCSSAKLDLDRCSAQLIGFGQGSSMYPHSMDELMHNYCPRAKKVNECIKQSIDCYPRFDRTVIDWILYSSKRMNNKRCKNEDEKVRFVRMANSCFSKMEDTMDVCMHNYIGSLDAIADDLSNTVAGDEDVLLQLSCCANNRFKTCMMNQAKKACKPNDNQLNKLKRTNSVSSQRIARKHMARSMRNMMDDLESTLDGMTLSGPELICRGLKEDFCRKRFDHRYSGRQPRHKSIVPALITIYSHK